MYGIFRLIRKGKFSGGTYKLVKESFKCKYRGKVMAKNIGEVDMYFVERKIAS